MASITVRQGIEQPEDDMPGPAIFGLRYPGRSGARLFKPGDVTGRTCVGTECRMGPH